MIKGLLDRCYPRPPRDVFARMVALYRPSDPLYTLEHDGHTVGMVYCARHSKGGHLESLAIDPDYRGLGLADRLVTTLVQDNPGVISLTTRIPAYFERLGFRAIEPLTDQSVFMIANRSSTRTASTHLETAPEYLEA